MQRLLRQLRSETAARAKAAITDVSGSVAGSASSPSSAGALSALGDSIMMSRADGDDSVAVSQVPLPELAKEHAYYKSKNR